MKIGIIGGSGLDNPEILKDYEEKEIDTPYGKPSSKIICGKLFGIDCCFLSRHGRAHEIPPSQINYRANISALKILQCTHIIASSAVGSLKEQIMPGDLVFPDQFVDFTKQRKTTFYDEIGKDKVVHEPLSDPFSKSLREILLNITKSLGFRKHDRANIVVVEGPRFSTRAESFFFRTFADIIGMTTVPEACLAREAGIEYASIAMATDYDCWKENEIPVTFEMVKKTMADNSEKVKKIIFETIKYFSENSEYEKQVKFIQSKIRSIPDFPKPGILFRDITPLFQDSAAFESAITILEKRYKGKNIDVIAGIESRGFIIASALALRLKKGLVLIRKKGKLPYEKISEEYELEYGKDVIEMHKDSIKPYQRVLLIDDLLATGGTMKAACNLVEKASGRIEECAFIINLVDLKGKEKINKPIFSILEFSGE